MYLCLKELIWAMATFFHIFWPWENIWAMGFFSWAMAGKVAMGEKNVAHGKNGKMLINVYF